MSNRFTTLPLFIMPFLSVPALADSELDSIVVTATRTEQSIEKLLSSVSVITRADIERFNYQTLTEALNTLPGVTIANNGGMGKQTSLFLRGTESNHTQVILNGVKLATNEFGAPQLEHIPLNQIERIELVRGPQSAIYGSESIGGTIQIFTKKGGNGLTPSLSVGFGSHNTKQASVGLSGGDDNNWFNVSIAGTETNGFNSCDGRSASLFIGCFANEPDKDGYDNVNTSLRAGHRFANDSEIEVFSLRSKGTTEYDGYYNETDFMQHTYGATFNTDITKIWALKTSLSQGLMEANNRGATATAFTDNKTNNFSLQNDIQITAHHLVTVGYDYENDKIDTSSNFALTERDNHAIYSQLLGQLGTTQDYRVALRVDDNEQFGSYTTGNIAWGTKLSDDLRFTVSYGTAFVAPSLVDLYSPFSGNADLDPERSKTYEIGLSGNNGNVDWSANIFQTKIDDLITLDGSFVPQNISEALIRGIELQAKTEFMGIDFDGQVSFIDPEDRSNGSNDGNVLARRAKQTFTLQAFKQLNDFSLATTFFASTDRYDDAANTRKLGGFATLDLIGAYKVNKATSLQLKVANLFDADYETVSGYNQDGTNVLFSINYQP